jgi:hypothetical protein
MFSVHVLGSSFQGSQPLSSPGPGPGSVHLFQCLPGLLPLFQGSLRSLLQAPGLQAPQAPGSRFQAQVFSGLVVPSRLRLQAQGPGLCSQ